MSNYGPPPGSPQDPYGQQPTGPDSEPDDRTRVAQPRNPSNQPPQNPYGQQPPPPPQQPPANPYGQPQQPPAQPSAAQPSATQPGAAQPGAPAENPYAQPPTHSAYGAPATQPQYGVNPYGAAPQYGATTPAPGDPGTLDLPWYGISFGGAVKRFFQKYARFDGRASRSEYWWAALGLGLVTLVLYALTFVGLAAQSGVLTGIFGMIFFLYFLAILIPSIALTVRRLHDANFSGWFYLLVLVPAGGLVIFVFTLLDPKPEGARFDRNR